MRLFFDANSEGKISAIGAVFVAAFVFLSFSLVAYSCEELAEGNESINKELKSDLLKFASIQNSRTTYIQTCEANQSNAAAMAALNAKAESCVALKESATLFSQLSIQSADCANQMEAISLQTMVFVKENLEPFMQEVEDTVQLDQSLDYLSSVCGKEMQQTKSILNSIHELSRSVEVFDMGSRDNAQKYVSFALSTTGFMQTNEDAIRKCGVADLPKPDLNLLRSKLRKGNDEQGLTLATAEISKRSGEFAAVPAPSRNTASIEGKGTVQAGDISMGRGKSDLVNGDARLSKSNSSQTETPIPSKEAKTADAMGYLSSDKFYDAAINIKLTNTGTEKPLPTKLKEKFDLVESVFQAQAINTDPSKPLVSSEGELQRSTYFSLVSNQDEALFARMNRNLRARDQNTLYRR